MKPAVVTEKHRPLSSGRSLILKEREDHEELEIRSPDGEIEVRVILTDACPIVTVRGARLQIEAPESMSVRCGRFEVHADEAAAIHSCGSVDVTGEVMRVRTAGDIHMDGDVIRLNCGERSTTGQAGEQT
jgi:hypothetical protein